MMNRTIVLGLICVALLTLAAPPAQAGAHLWRIHEVFSSADGSVQFIEMQECCGADNEIFLGGKTILSETTGNEFIFPANLPCNNCTANAHLLLATEAFAALPGAPTPDYILSENFFDLNEDILIYWLYTAATFPFNPGDLPTDGTLSLVCLAGDYTGCTDMATEVNSPTNFAGETGSVEVGPCSPADLDVTGDVGPFDLALLLGSWGPCPAKDECPADLDGDGDVGAFDLALLLGAWGPC